MKIRSVRAFPVRLKPAKPYQLRDRQPAGPLERYPAYRGKRSAAGAPWGMLACVVEAEDGTFGVGLGNNAAPVVSVIQDHFRPHLEGQDAMATARHFDVMCRLAAPYGGQGIASFAVSAADLALWDLKGKLLGRPVYELVGGPQKERVPCYATGFDVEWYLELGFKGVKLPMPYGPEDGLEGLVKAEEMVARARGAVGDAVELMLDCWMALDVEYAVQLAERLRPYRLKWIEDYLLPDDTHGFSQVRRRLPWQTLAGGEHWYLPQAFYEAARLELVDILQPDLLWAGGLSACLRVCHIAEAAGLKVIPHGGMNWPYGQHLAFAQPAVTWGERSGGVSPPGVPLADTNLVPGAAVIEDGFLVPSDAPGFGIDVDLDWLGRAAV